MLRRFGWVREQAAFLVVVLLVAVGFGYLLVDAGPAGRLTSTGAIASALLLGGLLRLSLPTVLAGMLAVRGRIFDALCYLAMGGVLLALDIRLRA